MDKKLRFSLKTQHRGSLRLLKSAPKPLKKMPLVIGACVSAILLTDNSFFLFCVSLLGGALYQNLHQHTNPKRMFVVYF